MNYLQICQKTARDSGTISGTAPSSVTSQSGRLLKVVNFVNDAWQDIQNARNAWLWLRAEFSKDTIAGTARYTATAWGLARFADWIVDHRVSGRYPTSIYLKATGVADEGAISLIGWDDWKAKYGRGSQTNGRPTQYAVSPAMELCLGSVPDAVYVVNGEYRKGNQTLSANADTPEMPDRFHELIVRRALELLAGHDERPIAFADSKVKASEMYFALERDQLPGIAAGREPLA